MAKDTKNSSFDSRTLNLKFSRGKIDQKEYDAFLKELPDCSENMEEINFDEDLELTNDLTEELTFSVG